MNTQITQLQQAYIDTTTCKPKGKKDYANFFSKLNAAGFADCPDQQAVIDYIKGNPIWKSLDVKRKYLMYNSGYLYSRQLPNNLIQAEIIKCKDLISIEKAKNTEEPVSNAHVLVSK